MVRRRPARLVDVLARPDGQGPRQESAFPDDRPLGARADLSGCDHQGRPSRILARIGGRQQEDPPRFFRVVPQGLALPVRLTASPDLRDRRQCLASLRWLPAGPATPTKLFLTSGGRANTLSGDGRLEWQPAQNSPPDRYSFDPKNPVPASMADQAIDRRRFLEREDVLVYTSAVLTEPIEVIGNVTVDLQAASDAFDTDFVAVLTDVLPDGRAIHSGRGSRSSERGTETATPRKSS